MTCPQCQRENSESSRFCNACGHAFVLFCPDCSGRNPPESRFCHACGRSLEPQARSTTAADVRQITPRSYTPAHLAEKILMSRAALGR